MSDEAGDRSYTMVNPASSKRRAGESHAEYRRRTEALAT